MANVKIEDSSAETKTAIKEIVGFVGDNLMANVTLRKATLADLLVVADGGDGEIAVASDADALVVYDGSSVGTVYPRAKAVNRVAGNLTFTAVATGATPTQLPISATAGYDPQSLQVGGVMAIPIADLPYRSGRILTTVQAYIVTTPGVTAGTEIILDIERQKVSDNSWSSILPKPATGIVPASTAGVVFLNYSTFILNTTWGDYDNLRFVASHSSVGSLFMLGEFDISFEEL